jgi:hypothetical protein
MHWLERLFASDEQKESDDIAQRLYRSGKSWLLAEYRGGGGRPKSVDFFPSQEAAAAALRSSIAGDDSAPEDSRHVYKVGHAGSARELARLMDASMSRYEWQRIADVQYRIATRGRAA